MPGEVLVVHEHQRLVVPHRGRGLRSGDQPIDQQQWEALAAYADRAGQAAFRIGHRKVTVGHHVGFLQVGTLRLEVLPKLQKSMDADWRALLPHMLREVLGVRITAQENSPLLSRPGAIYRVLLTRFLSEVDRLVREGLARAYREVESNERCMRGRLLVGRHLRLNAAHRERLYVAYPVFDADTVLNRIVHQGLLRVLETAPDEVLRSRAEALLGSFPEVSDARVRRADFERVRLSRSTTRYREALELARLILLSERPDLRWGGAPVVSLLFDMNALFEAYVLRQLRRVPGVRVRAQARREFWRAKGRRAKVLKPDLVVYLPGDSSPLVIDTKWKVPKHDRPDNDDLRQLFAYLRTFEAQRGLLLYPRATPGQRSTLGVFKPDGRVGGMAFLDILFEGRPDAGKVRAGLEELVRPLERNEADSSAAPPYGIGA